MSAQLIIENSQLPIFNFRSVAGTIFGMRLLFPFLVVGMLIGCAPTRTYQVAIKNELNQPITVWLTKSGPPVEGSWLSPEQLATYHNPIGGRIAGSAVPSGKVAEAGPLKGKFPAGTEAILRVYLGQHTLDELLATNSKNSTRVDVTLSPGRSDLIVRERDGKLAVEPSPSKL